MNTFIQVAHAAQPETIVQQMYAQIVERRPLGIPTGADRTAIWPFLSKRLVQILETAKACEDDYFQKHSGSDDKPEFIWLEMGLFSGDVEMAMPTEVVVERTEQQKNEALSRIKKINGVENTPHNSDLIIEAISNNQHILQIVAKIIL